MRHLAARLRERGLGVLLTHEPGGTALGNELRQLLLAREELAIAPGAEALLMNASRAQLVVDVIRPALERGDIVISDRFADSTLAYQGAGRGLDMQALNSVISFATAGLKPDVTLLLDVPVEVGLVRKNAQGGSNRFEAEALLFHQRVRDAYQALARAEPGRWHCFNGLESPDHIADNIWSAVSARMRLTHK